MNKDTTKLPARLVLLPVIGAGVFGPSCGADSREIRATVVDAAGRPVAGAVVYVEANTSAGAFDFAFAIAGPKGEVPAAGARPVTVSWRRGAKLALAAFAPGKKPTIVYDPAGRVRADGIVLELRDLPDRGERWEPRIAHLSYPFEADPRLATRARAPEYAELRRVLREAYAPLADDREGGLPREVAKMEALAHLDDAPSSNAGP